MKITVTICAIGVTEPEQRGTFDSIAKAGNFLCSYLNDEHAENSGSEHELWLAFADACAGLAYGGDFSFVYQGEKFVVEAVYDDLHELLDTYTQAERAAARRDLEGPSDEDVNNVLEEIEEMLPNFGSPDGKWRMSVNTGGEAPSPEYEPSSGTRFFSLYERNGRVQWPCALGIVTVWAV